KLPDANLIATVILKQAELYALLGFHEVLVKLVKPHNGVISYRRVVPKVFWKLVCSVYHDNIWMVVHQGRDKTLERISRKFYWNNMKQFVGKYCDECYAC